jgi:hypothetical protein
VVYKPLHGSRAFVIGDDSRSGLFVMDYAIVVNTHHGLTVQHRRQTRPGSWNPNAQRMSP